MFANAIEESYIETTSFIQDENGITYKWYGYDDGTAEIYEIGCTGDNLVIDIPGELEGDVVTKKLGCSEVKRLSKEFQTMAQNMTVQYLLIYSSNESGYKLDEDVVRNRVENLMADALAKNPALTAKEFAAGIKIPEIFMDRDAITYLVELVGEACEDDWIYFAYHYFSAYVFSFIFHHPYYVKSFDRDEVICVLYHQVYRALKSCAAKKSYFNFMTLKLMFKTAVFELNGVERFPFTLHRKDAEQYYRFRATIRSYNFGANDTEVIARMLSISATKIESYWQIYIMESKGFLSTSLVLDDENAEYIFGKADELGFADAETVEIRNRLFSSEEDRKIFDSLVGNGDGVFTKQEIEELNTSRYHINQVKERVRQDREGKGDIREKLPKEEPSEVLAKYKISQMQILDSYSPMYEFEE